MKHWKSEHIPNQKGKIAIVTGGNTGLGYEIALQLAKKKATVIIACRTPEKGVQAIKRIEQTLERSIEARVIPLDLTNIDSIDRKSVV